MQGYSRHLEYSVPSFELHKCTVRRAGKMVIPSMAPHLKPPRQPRSLVHIHLSLLLLLFTKMPLRWLFVTISLYLLLSNCCRRRLLWIPRQLPGRRSSASVDHLRRLPGNLRWTYFTQIFFCGPTGNRSIGESEEAERLSELVCD